MKVERAIDGEKNITQRGTRDPVDAVRLRGIPLIGGRDSVGRTMRRTRPRRAILRLHSFAKGQGS